MTQPYIKHEKKYHLTTRTIFLFLIFLIFLLNFPTKNLSAKETPAGAERDDGFDAVFVLDTSYSMNSTDKEQTAGEVINMFMDMSMAGRTRIGFVAYNHQIVAAAPLTSISVAERKAELKRKIKALRRSGYTDLGLGLRKGADLLAAGSSGRESGGRKPFLILLSDGETDFGPSGSGGRTKSSSAKDVTTVINRAKSEGYPIYTIGLNHDGTVNQQELERIASETGGGSYITSSADDLPEIFNKIFASQIRSVLVPVAGITATGNLQEVKVDIPNSSMEEANIILLSEHPLKETQLFYNSENIRLFKSDKYALLKISQPRQGTAKLKFRGTPGDLIKVNLLGSYSMEAQAKLKKDEAIKGQKTAIEAFLAPTGQPDQRLKDAAAYQALQAELVVLDLETNKEDRAAMNPTGTGFEVDYIFKKSGKYTWKVMMNGPNFYRYTASEKLEISNMAPEIIGSLNLDIVKEDGDVDLKLSDFIRDPNNDPLTYKLTENTSGMDAVLKDGVLTLSSLGTGSSTVTLTASDPEGGTVTATFNLSVSSKYTLLKLIGAAVLVLIAIGAALFLWLRPKPQFAGRLEGYFLNTASGTEIPVKYWPLTSFAKRRVALAELFRSLDVHEPLPEAEHIVFEAGKNGVLFVKHDTRCALLRGKSPLRRGKKELLNYNDKLYITFEDGVTEIELRYKAIKPSTNIYTGSDSAARQISG